MCPPEIKGNRAATSSGYMRMQAVRHRESDSDRVIRAVNQIGALSRSQAHGIGPSGLAGPGGTAGGNGSPASACSFRTDAGGYQVGSFCFPMTWVRPSGVRQSILPMLTG